MHWLPLVAMVIASALIFPYCPGLPRLVAATMEPGNNSSTRSLVNPIPKSNDSSHAEYMSSAKKSAEKLPHQTADVRVRSDTTIKGTSSLTKEDFSPEKTRQYEKAKPGSMDHMLQTSSKVQERHKFQEKHIHRNSNDDHFQKNHKVEPHIDGDETSDNGLKRKTEQVSVKRLTFTQNPRNLHIADGPTKKEDLKDLGREGMKGTSLPTMPAVPPERLGLSLEGHLQVDDELLLLDTHPRVLFSTSPSPPKHPPLQIMLELGLMPEQLEEHEMDDKESKLDKSEDGESYKNLLLDLSDSSEQETQSLRRIKRQIPHTGFERSVCEATSGWVMDRRTAFDAYMQNVTVLDKFPTRKGMMRQYFYETRCRGPDHRGVPAGEHGLAGAGCLGVDKRHWVSECQTKQSYVRAFTSDNARGTGWRWIRIDTSCVCVLYSRAQKKGLTTRQGMR